MLNWRTFINTTTICAIDLLLMFFVYEIAFFKAKLESNSHSEYVKTNKKLHRQKVILMILSVIVDVCKIYSDVTHL